MSRNLKQAALARKRGQAPPPGLGGPDFKCVGSGGVSDRLNAYPHFMKQFRGALYVGVARPVERAGETGDLDLRARIHALSGGVWSETQRSGVARGAREAGYGGCAEFQGATDASHALYVSTIAPARGACGLLRCADGEEFSPVALPPEFKDAASLQALTPFKGRLFASLAGPREVGRIVETRDPASGRWAAANAAGFGDKGNLGAVTMAVFAGRLYAGIANPDGFQLWRTDAEGDAPYRWAKLIDGGAGRGAENQSLASMCVHKDALYLGGGSPIGGIATTANAGAFGPELIRINEDESWDLIVGAGRLTPDGPRQPLSYFGPGFDSLCAGSFWSMGSSNGWLYVGAYKWSLPMNRGRSGENPDLPHRFHGRLSTDGIAPKFAGGELYRSADGENWIPVTTDGFGNPDNCGICAIEPTPAGLAVGTANPYAPKTAAASKQPARGGFEIWLGERTGG